jgi:hypothetical protein
MGDGRFSFLYTEIRAGGYLARRVAVVQRVEIGVMPFSRHLAPSVL